MEARKFFTTMAINCVIFLVVALGRGEEWPFLVWLIATGLISALLAIAWRPTK